MIPAVCRRYPPKKNAGIMSRAGMPEVGVRVCGAEVTT